MYINKYGMPEGDTPEEKFRLSNPNYESSRGKIFGGGTIGNPTKYYDPNEPGNARDMESRANYGRAIQSGPTPPSASFLDLKARSMANPENARFYGGGTPSSLAAQPDIAKQVLAQVLPDPLRLGGPSGMTALGATSLATSNGTTQPARSLSDMASQGNHAEEWTKKALPPSIPPPVRNNNTNYFQGIDKNNFNIPRSSDIRAIGNEVTQADDDTIGNDPFRKAFGGGLPTPSPTPSPSRFARFDFRSGIRNSLRTPGYEYDDEVVKFRNRYGFGSGFS